MAAKLLLMKKPILIVAGALAALLLWVAAGSSADIDRWRRAWPDTDFSKHSVPLDEIMSGGVSKDAIRSIDDPEFYRFEQVEGLTPTEPVIGLIIDGDARAYPLRFLTRHEIVNDTVGGVPVVVTYCPLCNAAIVFDRRIDGEAVAFGTPGNLRNSHLVMYDRRTESWWQQFTGAAIVGELTGTELAFVPARLESYENFQARAPEGRVLAPEGYRRYGANPYVGYDRSAWPFLYDGDVPDGVVPMMRVAAIDGEAWSLPLLSERGRVEAGELVLTWTEGQTSALDTVAIASGRDVGNVVAQRLTAEGLADIPYDVTFAFVFFAFEKDGVLHTLDGDVRWEE